MSSGQKLEEAWQAVATKYLESAEAAIIAMMEMEQMSPQDRAVALQKPGSKEVWEAWSAWKNAEEPEEEEAEEEEDEEEDESNIVCTAGKFFL